MTVLVAIGGDVVVGAVEAVDWAAASSVGVSLTAAAWVVAGGSLVASAAFGLRKANPAQTASATSAMTPMIHPQMGTPRRAPVEAWAAGPGGPAASTGDAEATAAVNAVADCVKAGAVKVLARSAALPSRWLMLGVIAATIAADVAALTVGFTTRGGVSISAPLAKSGPSGGICAVSKV